MQTAERIEFVYFDLGNVLVEFDPDLACRNVAACFGGSAAQAKAAIYDSGLQDKFERGKVSDDEYAASIRSHFGSSDRQPTNDQLLDAVGAMFTPIDQMHETLQDVRRLKLRIGILSNTCSAHWHWLQRQAYPGMVKPPGFRGFTEN